MKRKNRAPVPTTAVKKAAAKAAVTRLALPKKKFNAVRELVQEVVGLAPYERRLVEFLKLGREKRALRFAKRRVGTHSRGKKKREQMNALIQKQRAKAAK